MKKALVIIAALILVIVVGVFTNVPQKEKDPSVTVTNFEECVAAGNPVMESYPRQCANDGVTYVEKISSPGEGDVPSGGTEIVLCDPSERPAVCAQIYEPVCGLVQVECITTPCNPVPQTFPNGCSACSNERVVSYTPGACETEQ